MQQLKHIIFQNLLNDLVSAQQFQVFEIAKFKFKVTVHYVLWGKAPSSSTLRRYCTPDLKLACFVCYLKITETFLFFFFEK